MLVDPGLGLPALPQSTIEWDCHQGYTWFCQFLPPQHSGLSVTGYLLSVGLVAAMAWIKHRCPSSRQK